MDSFKRAELERRVVEAEMHIAEGERLLERQRASIEERRRDGHDVQLATRLLGEMKVAQRLHIAERDRMLKELVAP